MSFTHLLRSVVASDPAEMVSASENLKNTQPDRLIGLTATQQKLLDHVIQFYQSHTGAPQLSRLIATFEAANEADSVRMLEEAAALKPFLTGSYIDFFESEVERLASEELVDVCKSAIKIATVGQKIGKETIKGVDEAVSFIFSSAREKPKSGDGRLPSNLKNSVVQLDTLYQARKASPNSTYGIMTGYGLFDSSTAGIRKKQLRLHVGFGGHLKSTMMLNEIINAAVDGGYNPLLFTSEMPAEDVQMLLIAIHSGNPKFNGTGNRPLNAFKLLLGALDANSEAFFKDVKDDLANNPLHGSIRVIDSSEFTTFGSVMQRTIREDSEEEVDELWVDYITRLPIDVKYRSMDPTTARNEIIADAKRFAMSFKNGRGLAVCSPFQMNRDGYRSALKNDGRIDKTALAQYNAAEREADIITYVWFDKDQQANSEPLIGVVKSRWGKENHDPIPVFIEPDCRRIVDLSAGMTAAGYSPTAAAKASDEVEL